MRSGKAMRSAMFACMLCKAASLAPCPNNFGPGSPPQARSPDVDAATAAHSGAVGSVVLDAVTRSHDKVQRHVDALKVACQLLESLGRGRGTLGAKAAKQAEEAVGAALAGALAPKVQGQLQRLAELLRGRPGAGAQPLAQLEGKSGGKGLKKAATPAEQQGKGGSSPGRRAREGQQGGEAAAKRARK
jgi:hypothetical protein